MTFWPVTNKCMHERSMQSVNPADLTISRPIGARDPAKYQMPERRSGPFRFVYTPAYYRTSPHLHSTPPLGLGVSSEGHSIITNFNHGRRPGAEFGGAQKNFRGLFRKKIPIFSRRKILMTFF